MIKTARKKAVSTRPILISTLAAKLLGHSRTAGSATYSPQSLTLAFPAFNTLEMAYALDELLEKKLMLHKGNPAHETYVLTELGRDGRVGIS